MGRRTPKLPGGRRIDRAHAFRLIFQLEFHDGFDPDERVETYFDNTADVRAEGAESAPEGYEPDTGFVRRVVSGVAGGLPGIDGAIRKHLSGWEFGRLNKAELAALRMAVYEIQSGEAAAVAINEAVEIAKEVSHDGTGSFVNGILGAYAAELRESGRLDEAQNLERKST
ncbi:MAG: transcription antitermination factor NusB [Clostridiales bacterium]|jgi:N utilization substance protein B|nr:transcription antitermination factor NusB [Clostridiales bacterium]